MNIRLLYFIILAEGFVTISAEILTMRQLTPLVGNSVVISSLIIGVFLLALAYGYQKGGMYKDNYKAVLIRNFLISSLLLGLGLSYIGVKAFFTITKYLGVSDVSLMWGLCCFLAAIIAPMVYLLGQTVPIMMHLWKAKATAGAIGGRILQLSTLGSFLGAVLTSICLMNFLGVAWTVVINFALLITFIMLLKEKKWQLSEYMGIFILASAVFILNVLLEKELFIKTNSYNNYQIIEDYPLSKGQTGKLLSINDSRSAFIPNGINGKEFQYIALIKKILFEDLRLHDKSILVLGAGGFSLSKDKHVQDNHFTYVDIDPDIGKIIHPRYAPEAKGEFIPDDARKYLNSTTRQFDVIVLDVYGSSIMIPSHLITREFFQLIYNHLNKNGIALFNFIMTPTLTDTYSLRIDTTLRSVFQSCMSMPIKYADSRTNVIYACYKLEIKKSDGMYSDNLNQAMFDIFKVLH